VILAGKGNWPHLLVSANASPCDGVPRLSCSDPVARFRHAQIETGKALAVIPTIDRSGATNRSGVEMSSRAIVSIGVWILVMVLVGTLTVGMAIAFYVMMTLFFAALVGVLMVLTRRRDASMEPH
jgi:hypothetical protein